MPLSAGSSGIAVASDATLRRSLPSSSLNMFSLPLFISLFCLLLILNLSYNVLKYKLKILHFA